MKKLSVLVLIVLCAFRPANKQVLTISGLIVDKQTNRPVSSAYIVAVEGEEEVLSTTDGKFTLRTSLSVPFNITITHKDFEEIKTNIRDTSGSLLIQLTPLTK
ncbi:hypothetical protein QTN47_20225 [Danxiaibacter flavus]|uniref:Carboxypeptidase-like regulatory domain-containing protein n=1 Tax=Danxiaibacter flavus TaxID=3049108 RepID=A0ABV3ZJZ2_9BACT|nr:hypothetical protein QNM32_20230 [Chitinophagaceae bacterium DXS]